MTSFKVVVTSCVLLLLLVAASNGLSLRSTTEHEKPSIGAYRKNFKGDVTQVLSESPNSVISFPFLDVHDNFYYGKTIQLNCNASYPVQWVYNGEGLPSAHAETFRYAPDFHSPATYLHMASVVFSHSHPKQVGNYTCQGINKQDSASWFYVYVPDETIFLRDVNETQQVLVNPRSGENYITLPCTVSNPKAKVQIFRRLGQDMLKPITQRGFISFEPTAGFRIAYKNYKYVLGNYTCQVANEKGTDSLEFTVQLENEALSDGLDEDTDLIISHDKTRHLITCCNSKPGRKLPVIKSTGCESPSDCNLKRNFVQRKPCPGMCETHVVKVNENCAGYELQETRDAGLIMCSNGEHRVFHQFSKEEEALITEFSSIPRTEEILTIHKEPHPEDEGVDRYICHSNHFFFATGLKLAWGNRDGSLTFVDTDSFPPSNNVEIDDDHNHTALYCFAPVWNSATEWRNVSVKLQEA